MWEGQGSLRLPSGGTFEGSWMEGKWHGQGKHTRADGAVLEGEWRDGRIYNGTGRVLLADSGDVYEGEWREGKVYNGTSKVRAGDKITETLWVNGVGVKASETAVPTVQAESDLACGGS